jgi:type III pantothenate kinase
LILLTLDFGNSSAHAALYRHGKELARGRLQDVSEWLKAHALTFGEVAGVLSQVKSYDEELKELMKQGLLIERIQDYWKGHKFAGMPVHYAQSLGEDRLVTSWWAFKEFQTPTLVIDAGSFLTLDIVTSEGHQGGFILPGVKLLGETLALGAQLKAQEFTDLRSEILTGSDLPHTTADALQGAAVAYAALIQKLMIRWGVAQIVLTGGNTSIVEAWLKPLTHELPLHIKPDLVHWSLHEWYRRNIGA